MINMPIGIVKNVVSGAFDMYNRKDYSVTIEPISLQRDLKRNVTDKRKTEEIGWIVLPKR